MANPLVGPSGPGAFSKRTDVGTPEMKMGSIAYGEGIETAAIKAGAPLAKTGDVTPSQAPNVPAQTPVIPLFAPSQRPEEAVTSGIDMGAGAGSEALNIPQPDNTNFQATIRSYMPVLAYVADLPNTSPETRRIIRQLRDEL